MYKLGLSICGFELTEENFAGNAESLFICRKPEVFSTPKPNLGMWESEIQEAL